MAKIDAFEKFHEKYDDWFVRNENLYEAELEAVKQLLPKNAEGLEIGIGTGKFAVPLGIKKGIDPSPQMSKIAKEKGLEVTEGVAEKLPYKDNSYDFTLMVTSICFVDDPLQSFREALRVVKHNGSLLVGFVDKESKIGKKYVEMKDKSQFYKEATFYSTNEIIHLMKKAGFKNLEIKQTLLNENNKEVIDGYGEGSFVVVKGYKKEI